MTMSHYYSDIGMIEVDAYSVCTSRLNTNYQQRRISGFDVSPAASNGFSAIAATAYAARSQR